MTTSTQLHKQREKAGLQLHKRDTKTLFTSNTKLDFLEMSLDVSNMRGGRGTTQWGAAVGPFLYGAPFHPFGKGEDSCGGCLQAEENWEGRLGNGHLPPTTTWLWHMLRSPHKIPRGPDYVEKERKGNKAGRVQP